MDQHHFDAKEKPRTIKRNKKSTNTFQFKVNNGNNDYNNSITQKKKKWKREKYVLNHNEMLCMGKEGKKIKLLFLVHVEAFYLNLTFDTVKTFCIGNC